MFKLVRHGIAALGVLTDIQRVADSELVALVADHIPEGVPVLVGSGTLCLRGLMRSRHALHGLAGRSGKRGVERLLLLQTLDLSAESLHIRSHLVVLLHSGSLDQTVLAAMLFQKVLRLLPQVCTLVAKLKNLTHELPLSPEIRSGRCFCFGYKKSRGSGAPAFLMRPGRHACTVPPLSAYQSFPVWRRYMAA